MKKALICGVTGQDGAFLSNLLLNKNYIVYGGSRDENSLKYINLSLLKIDNKIIPISININDFRSTLQTILKIQPDEIYNLAGQSSVNISFDQPIETIESITIGTLNILEAIRFSGLNIKFYNAGSSECFGDTLTFRANENTPFKPKSPYAIAKSSAFWLVENYRDLYKIFACTGILFNHESYLRPSKFVTKKIITSAVNIYKGSKEKLLLGNIEIVRDWGWAPEYVEAMWLMLQNDIPKDYIVATGESHSLKEFVQYAFKSLGLNWENHVELDKSNLRLNDISCSKADPKKAATDLKWVAKTNFTKLVDNLIEFELNNNRNE
jgi:GDPmannose 4,6-dehydratase